MIDAEHRVEHALADATEQLLEQRVVMGRFAIRP
jgi:hypothetical protein